MKTKCSNFRTLTASGLALFVLAFVPLAPSQTNQSSPSHTTVATMETRSSFATEIENQLRHHGADARVQLDGDQRDVLRVQWQRVHRADIYNFVTSSAAQDARKMGFTSFNLTDGSRTWEYNLSRESMVVSSVQP